jgi:putative ABC transport system permease protein
VLHDLQTACRALLKARWFTFVTVLTLALGIGANTAIFGVVNRMLLSPLPYPDADSIVTLLIGNERIQVTAPNFVVGAWREQARSVEGLEAVSFRDVLAYDDNGARVLRGARITPGLPGFLGVAPLLGRAFTDADAEVGAPAVVLLSYELWQRDYGGASDVIGRAITLDDVPQVVVGVLPRRWDAFAGGLRPEVLLPLSPTPAVVSPATMEFWQTLARLKPGVSREAADAELDAILGPAMATFPQLFGDEAVTTLVEGPADRLRANIRDALLVLLAAVGLVLLVACSNVANLLLARGAARARELSLRSALGASTWRLMRALFAECLVLALAAGVVGVVFGWLTLRVLMWLRPSSLTLLDEVPLDGPVLAFTFGVSVATALLFGVAPALQLRSRRLADTLRHAASGVVRSGSGARMRKLLVAAQMALSVVLLVSAGLLVRSVIYLQNVDVGFDTRNLFTAQLTLPRGRYGEGATRNVLSEQLIERVRSSAGVAAVTQAAFGPPNNALVTNNSIDFAVRGVTLSEADSRAPRGFNGVRPDYFATVGVPLLAGRTFTAEERGGVAVINRAAAERYWPGGNAIGAEIIWGRNPATVVGIVGDTATLLRSEVVPVFYLPYVGSGGQTNAPSLSLIARAIGDPAVAIASLRAVVRELDPEIAVRDVTMLETTLANTIAGPRFNMALLSAFAVIALVLAAVGLAAVIGYEVTERTHEFGIRMALGAQAANVRRLAMRHGLTPAFVGVAVGVVSALAATQLAQSLLHGVAPRDPLTFVGVVALLVLIAFGASWLPARRATRVDPIAALRAE